MDRFGPEPEPEVELLSELPLDPKTIRCGGEMKGKVRRAVIGMVGGVDHRRRW